MSYCDLADVYPLLPTITPLRDAATEPEVVTATMPTATQGAALVAACEAEVIGVVAAAGVVLPVTDTEALNYLQSIIAYGSAALILKAKYPTAAGTGGDSGAGVFFEERYKAGLEALRAGAIGPAVARESGTVAHGFKDSSGVAFSSSDDVERITRETEF